MDFCSADDLAAAWPYARRDAADNFVFDVIDYEDVKHNLPHIIRRLERELRTDQYKPAPLLSVDIPKRPYTIRPGAVVSLIDLIVLYALVRKIAPALDAKLSPGVFSYRWVPEGKKPKWSIFSESTQDECGIDEILPAAPFAPYPPFDEAAPAGWFRGWIEYHERAKDSAARYNYCAVGDVTAYFENVAVTSLFNRIGDLLGPEHSEALTRLRRFYEYWAWHPAGTTTRGEVLPQGNDISLFLSNFYLTKLDEAMAAEVQNDPRRYFRYVDDICVFTDTQEQAHHSLLTGDRVLRDLGLNLNTEKTGIVPTSRLFDRDVERWLEDMSPVTANAAENARDFFKNRFDADDVEKWERAYLRALTTLQRAGDCSVAPAALQVFLENPTYKLLVKNFDYLSFFAERFRFGDDVARRITEGTFNFPFHKHYLYRLAAYCRQNSPSLREQALEEARGDAEWYVRIAALYCLNTFNLSPDELDAVEELAGSEAHPQVARAALVVLRQRPADEVASAEDHFLFTTAPGQENLREYFFRLTTEEELARAVLERIRNQEVASRAFLNRLHQLDLLKGNPAVREEYGRILEQKIDECDPAWTRLYSRLRRIAELASVSALRVRKARKIARAQGHLQTLLRSSREAVLITGPGGDVQVWNDAVNKLLGYGRREVRGKDVTDILPSPGGFASADELTAYVAENGGWLVEEATLYERPDGALIDISTTYSVITDPITGEPVGLLILVRDATAEVRAARIEQVQIATEQTLADATVRLVSPEDLDAAIEHTLRETADVLNAQRATVFRFREGTLVLDVTHEWCAPGVPSTRDSGGKLDLGELPDVRERLHSERVLSISNLSTPSAGSQRVMKERGVKAALVVPFYISDEMTGLIACTDTTRPRDWAYGEANLLFAVTALISKALARREAEEEKLVSEVRYRAVVEDQTELICRWRPDGTLTFVNEAYGRYFGKSPGELVGRSFIHFISEEDRETVEAEFASLGPDKPSSTHEHRVTTPAGEVRWQQWTNRVIIDEHGAISEYQSVGRDITERKLAEEALDFERRQLLSIYDSVEEVVYVADPRTHEIIYANEYLKSLYGKDMVGGVCYREFQGLEAPCDFCTNGIILEQKGKAYRWEFHNEILDKSFLCTDRIIKWPDGRDARIEIAIDISDRKTAEEALRKSEEEFRALAEQSLQGVTLATEDRTIFANRAFYNITGYEPDEIIGLTPGEVATLIIRPEDRETVKKNFRRRMDGESAPSPYAVGILHKNGSTRWAELYCTIVDIGGPPANLTTLVDITERKRAEEAIRESEVKYRTLFENSPDALTILDTRAVISDLNRATEELTGYSREELLGRPFVEIPSLRAQKRARLRKLHSDLVAGREAEPYELEIVRRDGTRRWVNVTVAAIKKGSDLIGTQLIGRDVTERKLAEEKIKRRLEFEGVVARISSRLVAPADVDRAVNESLADIGRFLGAGRVPLFLLSRDGSEMSISHEWCAAGVKSLIGELQGEPTSGIPWWTDRLGGGEVLHIPDVSRMPPEAAPEQKILEGQGIKSILVLPVEIGGSFSGFVALDNVEGTGGWDVDDVELLRVMAADLGRAFERQRAESILRENEERYRDLVEGSHDLVQSVAPDARFLFVNRAWLRTMGYAESELPNLTLFDVIHPDYVGHCQELFQHVMRGETVSDISVKFVTKDGREIILDGTAGPRFMNGEVVSTQGFFHDVTERKRAEEKLKRHSEEIAAVSELAIELAGVDTSEEMFPLIARRLRELTGALAVLTTSYDYEADELAVNAVEADVSTLDKTNDILGAELSTIRFPFPIYSREALASEHVAVTTGIPHQAHAVIPKNACRVIEEAFGIGDVYILTFHFGGDMIGAAGIIMQRETTRPSVDTLEAAANTIATTLRSKLAEEALVASEREKTTILECVDDMVVFCNSEMETVWANPAAAAWHDMTPEEMVGRRCYEERYGRTDPCEDCAEVEALRTGEPREIETTSPDGRSWYNRSIPVTDDSGAVVGVVTTTQEVTARYHARETLKQRATNLAAINDLAVELASAPSADAIRRIAGDRLRTLGGALAAIVTSYDEEAGVFVVRHISAPGDVFTKANKILNGTVYDIRCPVDDDAYEEILARRVKPYEGVYDLALGAIPRKLATAIEKALGLGEIIAAGFRHGGRVLGGISVVMPEGRPAPDAEILENFANVVSSALVRQAADEWLVKSEREKSAILANMTGLVAYMKPNLEIVWANDAAADWAGLTPREMAGRYCYDVWYGRTKPCKRCHVVRTVESGEAQTFETDFRDGSVWHVQCNPVRNAAGEVVGIVETSTDISARKRAEESRRETEARYRALVDTMNDGFIAHDERGVITYVNDRLCEILGFPRENIEGRPMDDFLDRENAATLRERRRLKKPRAEAYELCWTGEGGRRVYTVVSPGTLPKTEGRSAGGYATIADITVRKRAEENLQRRSDDIVAANGLILELAAARTPAEAAEILCEGLKRLTEALAIALLKYDVNTRELVIEYVAAENDVKSESGKILGGELSSLRFPLDRAGADELVNRRVAATKGLPRNVYGGVPRKDVRAFEEALGLGEVYVLPLQHREGLMGTVAIVTRDENPPLWPGAVEAVVAAAAAVHERVEAAEKLRASEETAQVLLNAPANSAFLLDAEGTILAFNETTRCRTRLGAEDLRSASLWEILPPAVVDARKGQLEEVVRTGRPVHFEEKRPGSAFESYFHPIRGPHGVTNVALFSWPVTLRKEIEEKLAEPKKDFRPAAEASPVAALVLNHSGGISWVNKAALSLFGYAKKGQMKRLPLRELFHAEDEKEMERVMDLAAGSATTYAGFTALTVNGERRPTVARAAPVFEDGKRRGVRVLVDDVSERVRTAEALAAGVDPTELLSTLTSSYAVVADGKGAVTAVNTNTETRLCKPADDVIGTHFEFTVPRGTEESRKQAFEETLRSGKAVLFEDETTAATYENDLYPILDGEGNVSRVAFFSRDVTGSKATAEALSATEAKTRLLANQIPAIIWTTDDELRITSLHGGGLAFIETPPAELRGKTLPELYGTNEVTSTVIAAHRQALRGEVATYDQEIGSRTFQATVEPCRDGEGRVVGCVGAALNGLTLYGKINGPARTGGDPGEKSTSPEYPPRPKPSSTGS
ncbi:MAG: PAS domain S-box protein [Candidatus Zixiibacteriota bacterium]|jgi:PAS domain S-box-containing protein